VPPHDLAEALGVPDPWKPGSDGSFTQYAEIVKVEQYARNHSPASGLVYLIKDSVDAKRFELLVDPSAPLDDVEAPSFSFLLSAPRAGLRPARPRGGSSRVAQPHLLERTEREALQQAIAGQQLESNQSNGMCCIARYSVASPAGDELEFEGDIEDDGA
jgi:hypothetical protein